MWQRFFGDFKAVSARLAALPFRVLAYVLHATGLERFIKPSLVRNSVYLTLTEQVIEHLPKYSQSITGAKMDPMNLIIIGSAPAVRRVFRNSGWHRANPASPVHLMYGLFSAITKRSYHTGPFTPFFVSIALQDLAYQQPTKKGSFDQRHHLRLWRTGVTLPGKKVVWVASAQFDESLKVQLTPPFVHHRIDPNIDRERDYVVRSLVGKGGKRLMSVPMTKVVMAHQPAQNGYGQPYFTDGRAVVVQV